MPDLPQFEFDVDLVQGTTHVYAGPGKKLWRVSAPDEQRAIYRAAQQFAKTTGKFALAQSLSHGSKATRVVHTQPVSSTPREYVVDPTVSPGNWDWPARMHRMKEAVCSLTDAETRRRFNGLSSNECAEGLWTATKNGKTFPVLVQSFSTYSHDGTTKKNGRVYAGARLITDDGGLTLFSIEGQNGYRSVEGPLKELEAAGYELRWVGACANNARAVRVWHNIRNNVEALKQLPRHPPMLSFVEPPPGYTR